MASRVPAKLPVRVVQLCRAVQTQPDQKTIPDEQVAPIPVEKQAVRLEGVGNILARRAVHLHQERRPPVEVQTRKGRLAALPTEHRLRQTQTQIPPNYALEHAWRHPVRFNLWIHPPCTAIETIGAVLVAICGDWFHEQLKVFRHGPFSEGICSKQLLLNGNDFYSQSSRFSQRSSAGVSWTSKPRRAMRVSSRERGPMRGKVGNG